MAQLYRLRGEYEELYDKLMATADPETGEVDVDISAELAKVEGDLQDKALSIGEIVRRFDRTSAEIDDEIKRLTAMKKAVEGEKNRLKTYLSDNLQALGIESVKGVYANISFRKSVSVDIYDDRLLPPEYWREKVTREPDKTKIKEALLKGEEVLGAVLRTALNIQIK